MSFIDGIFSMGTKDSSKAVNETFVSGCPAALFFFCEGRIRWMDKIVLRQTPVNTQILNYVNKIVTKFGT